MAWITSTNIQNMIGANLAQRMTDDTDPAAEIDATVWTEIAAEVEADVAAALYSRYPAQCAAKTESTVITGICKALAYRKLCFRRPEMSASQMQISEIQDRMDALEKIANGSMSVPDWSESSDSIEFAQKQYGDDEPDGFVDWLDKREETTL